MTLTALQVGAAPDHAPSAAQVRNVVPSGAKPASQMYVAVLGKMPPLLTATVPLAGLASASHASVVVTINVAVPVIVTEVDVTAALIVTVPAAIAVATPVPGSIWTRLVSLDVHVAWVVR